MGSRSFCSFVVKPSLRELGRVPDHTSTVAAEAAANALVRSFEVRQQFRLLIGIAVYPHSKPESDVNRVAAIMPQRVAFGIEFYRGCRSRRRMSSHGKRQLQRATATFLRR
jgi:hypothetical protein